jgi:hypothetical protein
MVYDVRQWPSTIYPGEVDSECPEAGAIIVVLIKKMGEHGPSPPGYHVKTLGANVGGLWQINLKVEKRQVRILYAPYKQMIVLFRIHKKGSKQEQMQAYELAKKRKRQFELTARQDS